MLKNSLFYKVSKHQHCIWHSQCKYQGSIYLGFDCVYQPTGTMTAKLTPRLSLVWYHWSIIFIVKEQEIGLCFEKRGNMAKTKTIQLQPFSKQIQHGWLYQNVTAFAKFIFCVYRAPLPFQPGLKSAATEGCPLQPQSSQGHKDHEQGHPNGRPLSFSSEASLLRNASPLSEIFFPALIWYV